MTKRSAEGTSGEGRRRGLVPRAARLGLLLGALAGLPGLAGSAEAPAPAERPKTAVPNPGFREPFPEPYPAVPEFVAAAMAQMGGGHGREREALAKAMDLSFEPAFYTLNDLQGYSKPEPRSAALVKKALEKEGQGEFREALEIYQKVIADYPEDLHRISKYGIYVPVSQYCQRRILQFPAKDLQFYREKHDQRAREAFEQARGKNSLEGLAEVRDRMLATSYGGPACRALGDAALDRGHYLEALEYYETVRDFFPDKGLQTPELALKIVYCRRMLGEAAAAGPGGGGGGGELSAADRARLQQVVSSAKPERPPFHSQLASAPNVAADDYTLHAPTADPLGIAEPVWEEGLANSQLDCYAYSQPVITGKSAIYRHKNIVYCRSILTGELRWKNDLGGRVTWQDWDTRQYPQEDVLVQDGLVFTPLYKMGPTLVALDEVTGQLRWARGPMAASTPEEAKMRFECAPAGGPRTVYAGYVLDDIEGDTHVDTEYGVMALESTTGRILWRRAVCRYRPGLFSAGMAVRLRNRIRSFASPPLYHQGTVYTCTNSGALAALDALSGRVKWVMHYPYYAFSPDVHDMSRQFGSGGGVVQYTKLRVWPHRPMFWYNQRPLLVGDDLYITPVDSPFLLKVDRRNGRIVWARQKGEGINARRTDGGPAYFLGPTLTGELAVVYSFREIHKNWAGPYQGGGVYLLDPKTGKTVWESGDLVEKRAQPLLKYNYGDGNIGFWAFGANSWEYMTSARPFLSSDNRVCVTGYYYHGWPFYTWASNLAVVDISQRKVVERRNYLDSVWMALCDWSIKHAHERIKLLEEVPHKTDRIKEELGWLKEIQTDSVPENPQGPFLPFARLTSKLYGTTFELRVSPRSVAMVYDREAVKRSLAGRDDPEGLFARAELAMGESRLDQASGLLEECLRRISAEDMDFRAMINQQLYQVHKRLARAGVRAGQKGRELENCLGMSRTVGTLADEIETLFALAEAYERRGEYDAAERMLRNAIAAYGHYEYPVPSALGAGSERLLAASQGVLDRGREFAKDTMYGREMGWSLELLKEGMPLYFSALSPLGKDLTVRTGEAAARQLTRLQGVSGEFRKGFEDRARGALERKPGEEQLHRLWEYPATGAAQAVLEDLLAKSAKQKDAEGRRRLWLLSDLARICSLKVPEAYRPLVGAPPAAAGPAALSGPFAAREETLQSKEGTAWLALERRGDQSKAPDLLFLGGRVQKRFDSKFLVSCVEMKTGKVLWQGKEEWGDRVTEELSLRGKGHEAGFFEAFVHGDLVVVHGLYDVLAFDLASGKLRWRYQVPFDFEIRHAENSGDLLVLAGKAETVALYLLTGDPRGEVAWQEKEEGDIYIPPYFHGDRLVSVRKLPFNVTVRYRATGRLVGRLELPDLSVQEEHPLLKDGPRELPAAHDGRLLALSDGWYYLLVDVEKMKVEWKRLIDNSDPTRDPAMRFALKGDYFAVVKEDFDQKTIYMLSSKTGEVLWNTDPKVAGSPQPMHSMIIEGDRLYGIAVHAGQGFHFVGRDCKTGKRLFSREEKGYDSAPQVRLVPALFGERAVSMLRDRQDFELKVFDLKDGGLVHQLKAKGTGDFGEHGRVSAVVQNGRLVLLSKDKFWISGPGGE